LQSCDIQFSANDRRSPINFAFTVLNPLNVAH
jgi:hypothetical protein